jgi:hypothetical protein
MIVTTGRSIKVEIEGFIFHCSCETPGIVTVTAIGNRRDDEHESITLRAGVDDMEKFIAAYRRCVVEDIPYRKRENEFPEDKK